MIQMCIRDRNVQKTGRMKIPFGIAQIGKAFRNEIVARQFIFRMREFEQMEMQLSLIHILFTVTGDGGNVEPFDIVKPFFSITINHIVYCLLYTSRLIGSYMAYAFYNGGQIQRWQAESCWKEENRCV